MFVPVFVRLNATLLSLIASFCYLASRLLGSRLVQMRLREELQQRLVLCCGWPLEADGKASQLRSLPDCFSVRFLRNLEPEACWIAVH